MTSNYTAQDLRRALERVGVRRGDVAFSHGNVGYFGVPAGGLSPDNVFQTVWQAFQDVLGPEGTLVVPTFTYSFCRGEVFDPDDTPSTCGLFTEKFRRLPGARRSEDPLFSVAAAGPLADELTRGAPEDCFGDDSFWERFLKRDGLICNLNFDAGSTFLHYVERRLRVPYRFLKRFPGTLRRRGEERPAAGIHFCHDLEDPDTEASFELFDRLGRAQGVVKTAAVGRGSVVALRAKDAYRLMEREIRRFPDLLIAAGKRHLAEVEAR